MTNVHMYYILNWFIPSIFLLSTLILFMENSTGLKILHSFLYRKYINHIYLLYFLLYPFLLLVPSLFFILVFHCLGVCLLLSGVFALALYLYRYCAQVEVTPSTALCHSFLPNPVLTVFSVFHYVLFLHRCDTFHYYLLYLSFLLFFLL
jgi:hypothetical protein